MQIIRRPHRDPKDLPESLHPVIKQIYANRGINRAEQLELTLAAMEPVTNLNQVELAASLVSQAMLKQQKITVIGDFDADGATSTALMHDAFNLLGYGHHDFLVPNRFKYGYGLTPEIVDIAYAQGTELIITVDNGIACVAGVAHAKTLGLTVIITDHHLPAGQLPNADAIVNPNHPDCHFSNKSIAGVGVAFYFQLALRKQLREQDWFAKQQIAEPNFASLLDLVAIGTVADVVALEHNNRILVEQGLRRIRAGKTRPGIQALIQIAGKNQAQLQASDIGFGIAPRINAAGRLEDMAYGINCLLAPSYESALTMAQYLNQLNHERRQIEQQMQGQAEAIMAQINAETFAKQQTIVLFQEEWHQGVIGIVAGRLKEKFYRPCIVFAPDNETENSELIKGSARSIAGVHIKDLLERVNNSYADLIEKFGGHAMAAGLTLQRSNYEKFCQAFEQLATEMMNPELLSQHILSDGPLPTEWLTQEFAQLIKQAGPFGQAFEQPIFDDEFQLIQQRIVGEKHLKLVVAQGEKLFDAIYFNIDPNLWPNEQVTTVRMAYELDINEFRGKCNLQLLVRYLEPL